MNRKVGVGIILINSKREVLLLLRDDKPGIPHPNAWDLPGGHVEEKEVPENCIRREMMEEMELALGDITLFKQYSWPEFEEYIFWKEIDLDPSTLHLHEGQRLRYFSLDEINGTPIAFHYNKVLPEFFDFLKTMDV